MKNKKLLIIPIILIILLVLGAGLSAIIYFQTDLFKSPKQLFFKYLGESIDFDKEFDYDKFLAEYKEKTEKSYTSNGEITASLNYDESENNLSSHNNSSSNSTALNSTNYNNTISSNVSKQAEEVLTSIKDSLNKTKIQYSEEAIPTKQKYHMNIKPIYNDNEITNLELLSSGDNYGVKCSDLYDKYVYIENNNLKSLVSKFGINSSIIPDKITKTNPYELLYVAPETRKQVSEKYQKLLDEKLTKDMFTKQKNVSTSVNGENVEATSYTLTLNGEQTYDILRSFLQELKEDDLSLDLLIQKLEQSGAKESFENAYSTVSSMSTSSTNTTEDTFVTLPSTTSSSTSSKKTNITLDKDYLKEMIQDMIDELEDDKDSFTANETISFTIYSYKGKTVKLEISNNQDNDNINIQITTNKNEKLVTLNYNDTTILKANYSVSKDKNTLIMNCYDDDGNEIAIINMEYGKESIKLNLKSESQDSSSSSLSTNSNDFSMEINLETSGEIGKDTVNTTGYINIYISGIELKLNINENTTYTDNVTIDDLTANNGELLNEMSNTKMNSLFKEISDNFQKVLPEKANLLGIELPDNTTNNNDEDSNVINQKDLNGYSVYTHSSGLQFAYPENWKSLGNSSDKPVFSNSETGTNVNLLSETIPTGYDLKTYMDASISNIKTQMSDKIDGDITSQYVKLNGRDASIITYTMTQSNTKVKIKQACFIDDNTAYILTLAALEDKYTGESETIDNIISSFKK